MLSAISKNRYLLVMCSEPFSTVFRAFRKQ
jgi:hypothetical protein